jgi:hypothetical protein
MNIKEEKKSCEPFWRVALTGHGQSSQSADFWKIAQMTLFNPWMKFEIFRGPNYFSKCETIVRTRASSSCHSDPDPSSVHVASVNVVHLLNDFSALFTWFSIIILDSWVDLGTAMTTATASPISLSGAVTPTRRLFMSSNPFGGKKFYKA